MTMLAFYSYCTKLENLVLQMTESLKLGGNCLETDIGHLNYLCSFQACSEASWGVTVGIFYVNIEKLKSSYYHNIYVQ